MNRVLKYLKKHKIGKRLLSLLLCLLTVVCFGGILEPLQAHAVTGVEEIITFVIGILIACGVTFTSAEAAQSTARRYYNSVDSDTKSIIDKAKEQYDAKKEYYTVTTNGLIMCLASEWQKIFDSIASFIFNPSVIADSSYVDLVYRKRLLKIMIVLFLYYSKMVHLILIIKSQEIVILHLQLAVL